MGLILSYGVYIPTKNTPIYSFWRDQNHVWNRYHHNSQNDYPKYLDHCYDRLRRVIALSRIVMRNVNITTSEHHMLMQPEAVSDLLNSGANVIKMFSGPLWTRQFNLVGMESLCDL